MHAVKAYLLTSGLMIRLEKMGKVYNRTKGYFYYWDKDGLKRKTFNLAQRGGDWSVAAIFWRQNYKFREIIKCPYVISVTLLLI